MTFGSVNFLKSYEKLSKNGNIDGIDAFSRHAAAVNLQSVIRQAKIISQIISYLWLQSQNELEGELEGKPQPMSEWVEKGIKWFQNPKSEIDPANNQPCFQNLLTIGDPRQDRNAYDKLLREVFSHLDFDDPAIRDFYQFPIYYIGSETDPIQVSFEVDNSVFHGYLKDPDPNSPHLFSVVVAFPPCPQFKGATFTKTTLEGWQTNIDPYQITPPSAYIPTCTS